jgi:hypothetical protein
VIEERQETLIATVVVAAYAVSPLLVAFIMNRCYHMSLFCFRTAGRLRAWSSRHKWADSEDTYAHIPSR